MSDVKKWFKRAKEGKPVFVGFKNTKDVLGSFKDATEWMGDRRGWVWNGDGFKSYAILMASKALVGDGRYEAFILVEDRVTKLPAAVISQAGGLRAGEDGTLQAGDPLFDSFSPVKSTWDDVGAWLRDHFPDRTSPGIQADIFELVRAFVWNRTGKDPLEESLT